MLRNAFRCTRATCLCQRNNPDRRGFIRTMPEAGFCVNKALRNLRLTYPRVSPTVHESPLRGRSTFHVRKHGDSRGSADHPAALHQRRTGAAGCHALDAGAGRISAFAIFGLSDQCRAGGALFADRSGRSRGHRLHRHQDPAAVHHHDHRLHLGEGGLRSLPVRPQLLLGRRVQHAGTGPAYRVSGGLVHRSSAGA